MAQSIPVVGTHPGFAADLRGALRVWRGSPFVPAVYLVIGVVLAGYAAASPVPRSCQQNPYTRCTTIDNSRLGLFLLLSLITFPVFFFQIGLAGGCRVWYSRRYAGAEFSPRELWTLSWRFFGRFFLLGLVFVLIALPFSITALIVGFSRTSPSAGLLVSAIGALGADVLLTFATPTLALYETDPWRAFTHGIRVLRAAWPQCAAYALVPPLALQLTVAYSPHVFGQPAAITIALLSPLISLLFTGASVAFLIRLYAPPAPDGSLVQRFPGFPKAPRRPGTKNHWTEANPWDNSQPWE